MTTRAIVPNGDGEGSLGTSTAKWGAVYSSDPARGENSGQVPTTAWVQKLLADALAKQKTAYEQAISTAVSAAQTKAKLDAHPVGSYYWSNDSTSPATLFGGTWEALPAGYTLIAQGSGSDSFGSYTYTAGQKYGERKHQLTTDELASHGHMVRTWNNVASGAPQLYRDGKWERYTQGAFKVSGEWNENAGTTANSPQGGLGDPAGTTDGTGGNAAHNNIQPSIAAYCWKRTA
ncbi:phage baseplate protein [Acidaminococcus sp. HCP3S3_H5]|uniref:phage baseplate protein n=1 Tax=Acidaminococcus sp. HCP3S3_H5 TaxID=3438733 RepID=UPI003F93F04E